MNQKPKGGFTDRWLRSIPIPASGQFEAFDAKCPGLSIRVGYGGARAFYYSYRFDGRRRRLKLGRFPTLLLADARAAVRERERQVAAGQDPQGIKRARLAEPNLKDLFLEYRRDELDKQKRGHQVVSRFERSILPALGSRKLADIDRDAVKALFASIPAPTEANATVANLRALFRWAIEEEKYKGDNPAAGIKRNKTKPKTRALDCAEITRFWSAAMADTVSCHGRALAFILATGQRPGEVRDLKWSDIDGRRWHIEDPKNEHPHRVYLTDMALELLKDSSRDQESPFPVSETRMCAGLKRILRAAGVANATPHDLRRTWANHASKAGATDDAIDRCLNHVRNPITQTYLPHAPEKLKRETWLLAEQHLLGVIAGKIVDEEGGEVVELQQAK